MYWILRIIIELSSELGKEFLGGVKPINSTFEIILLFLTLVCIVLVARRSLIGGLTYLSLYAIYFGGDITNKLMQLNSSEKLSFVDSVDIALSAFGIILAIFVVVDILIDKKQRLNPKDSQNDWFFNNSEYDRKLDDRADKNHYRTM